ncbi:MAG: hypothetical protein RL885_16070 [Planctomycetota bacterium]
MIFPMTRLAGIVLLALANLSLAGVQTPTGTATGAQGTKASVQGLDRAVVGEDLGASERLTTLALPNGQAIPNAIQSPVVPLRIGISTGSRCLPITDGPRIEPFGAGATRLLIPGFGAVYLVRFTATSDYALIQVDELGRSAVLFQHPIVEGASPIDPVLGASRHGWVAFGWEGPDLAFLGVINLSPRAQDSRMFDKTPVGPGWDEANTDSFAFAHGRLYFGDETAPRGSELDGQVLYSTPAVGPERAAPVALPPTSGAAPNLIDGEIAMSPDESTIAFRASSIQSGEDVYVIDPNGQAINVTNNPQRIASLEDDGVPGAARLAVSRCRVAFLVVSDVLPDEMFTLRFDAGVQPPKHVTSSVFFVDSIDTPIGMVADDEGVSFHAGQTLTALDVYRATDSGGTLDVQNQTATSGDVIAPFDKGATMNFDRYWVYSGVEGRLVQQSTIPGLGDVLTEIDRRTGALLSASLYASIGEWRPILGSEGYMFTARPIGSTATQVYGRLANAQGPFVLTGNAAGTDVRQLRLDSGRRYAAWIVGTGAGAERVERLEIPSLVLSVISSTGFVGDSLSITGAGSLIYAQGPALGQTDFFVQSRRGGQPRQLSAAPGLRVWNP